MVLAVYLIKLNGFYMPACGGRLLFEKMDESLSNQAALFQSRSAPVAALHRTGRKAFV